MGRHRRCLGTYELPRADVRSPEFKTALSVTLRSGATRPTGGVVTANGSPIRLEYSPCRFGGQRPWLVCESCGRRRLVLYGREFVQRFVRGEEFEKVTRWYSWRCRRCLRLVYPSQRASRDWRYYAQLRIEALVRRFAPSWDYADEFPDKPPRIRRRTWNRLCKAVSEWEGVRDAAFWRRVAPLLRRAGR